MAKTGAAVKCIVTFKVSIRTSLTGKLISCFFWVPTRCFLALKAHYPTEQWLLTWMLPVSPILQSSSLILGPQNSSLTLEMLCRLRRSLEMPGLLTMTFVKSQEQMNKMKTQSSAKFSSTRRDKALKFSTSSVIWRVQTSSNSQVHLC